jgi:NhaA family Na+:H+ antiporter
VDARYVYFPAGVIIWYLFLKSGIHPTIAGVLLALVIPANRKIGKITYAVEMKELAEDFENSKVSGVFLGEKQLEILDSTEELLEKVQPYLQHLEHRLHPLVAFVIMPVFALANAGVELSGGAGSAIDPVAWHVGLALILGKVAGISLFAFIGVKLALAEYPAGIGFRHIFSVSFLGAVGFTMALFINSLAFSDPGLINSSKVGIIGSSVVAGIIGYILLRITLKTKPGS